MAFNAWLNGGLATKHLKTGRASAGITGMQTLLCSLLPWNLTYDTHAVSNQRVPFPDPITWFRGFPVMLATSLYFNIC